MEMNVLLYRFRFNFILQIVFKVFATKGVRAVLRKDALGDTLVM